MSAMKGVFEKKLIAVVFLLAFILMAGIRFVSYRNAIALIDSTNRVEQIEDEYNHLVEIFSALTDAEAGYLEYLLLGDEAAINRYTLAMAHLDQHLQQLNQMLADDDIHQSAVEDLEALVAQRRALVTESIGISQERQADPEGAIAQNSQPINHLNQNRIAIEQILNRIKQQKRESLATWTSQQLSETRYHLVIEILGTALIFALMFGLYGLIERQLSQRQKAEQERQTLAQKTKMSDLKLQFFSMVSHEFRTPLSIILGSAQLLADTLGTSQDPKTAKNLNRIQSSARDMNQLLSDLLTLMRAEAGQLTIHPSRIDLESFCLNLVEDFNTLSQSERTIQFVSQNDSPIYANLDEKLLYALLSNLLSNAIKYSPADAPIVLTLSSHSHAVVFHIRDQGIGIPKDTLAKLYEPFYRGDNVGKTSGSGVGLAVCKKCVDLHQGSISIDSKVGVGTTVTVTLPFK
jgi:signal transduction histidine kinase